MVVASQHNHVLGDGYGGAVLAVKLPQRILGKLEGPPLRKLVPVVGIRSGGYKFAKMILG